MPFWVDLNTLDGKLSFQKDVPADALEVAKDSLGVSQAAGEEAGSTAEVWEIADGHWAASIDLGSRPAGSSVAAIGDFDHNGVSDVMWHNDVTAEMTSWLLDAQHQLTAKDFLFA